MDHQQIIQEYEKSKALLMTEVQKLIAEKGQSNVVRITGLPQSYVSNLQNGLMPSYKQLLKIHAVLTD
jgi:predicted XRE-type DNA-binding protein